MSINVDDISQGKSQNKAKVVELLVVVSIVWFLGVFVLNDMSDISEFMRLSQTPKQ